MTNQGNNMNVNSTITTVFVADSYGKGCPSNASGRQVGVGMTREKAIQNCEPWANQSPWFRSTAKKVIMVEFMDEDTQVKYPVKEPTDFIPE